MSGLPGLHSDGGGTHTRQVGADSRQPVAQLSGQPLAALRPTDVSEFVESCVLTAAVLAYTTAVAAIYDQMSDIAQGMDGPCSHAVKTGTS